MSTDQSFVDAPDPADLPSAALVTNGVRCMGSLVHLVSSPSRPGMCGATLPGRSVECSQSTFAQAPTTRCLEWRAALGVRLPDGVRDYRTPLQLQCPSQPTLPVSRVLASQHTINQSKFGPDGNAEYLNKIAHRLICSSQPCLITGSGKPFQDNDIRHQREYKTYIPSNITQLTMSTLALARILSNSGHLFQLY